MPTSAASIPATSIIQDPTADNANGSSLAAYAALIRTFNSQATLPRTVAFLQQQSSPPEYFVIVDSGSTDRTREVLPANVKYQTYSHGEFNYSKAINQGLADVDCPYVLVVSSHTQVQRHSAIQYALRILERDHSIAAAYFQPDERDCPLSQHLVDRQSFDGFNGIFNTCALIRTSLLSERQFRPEVFSAEDQEWSAWLFRQHPDAKIARIAGAGVRYANPYQGSLRKKINEQVAIAYFIRRDLLNWSHVVRLIYTGLLPANRRQHSSRRYYFWLSWRLAACRFRAPSARSRYF